MHFFIRPNNRIDGAGLDAKRASDTPLLLYPGNLSGSLGAVGWIKLKLRLDRLTRYLSEFFDACSTAWRAAVDFGLTRTYGLGIAFAVRIAAARALGLRQRSKNLGKVHRDRASSLHLNQD